ncbi:MAG: sigma-70 family RNA polymerase sigma factor [Magnetospirillum sp.]|nr:sigma-70 family RNA polymerase sigma factor [Magnetospirillum sp.]
MAMTSAEDRTLIRHVLDAKPQAWDRFIHRIAQTVWTSCRLLTGDESQAQAAFAEVISGLCEDGFRRLRPYDGSSRIEVFVALVAREILSERLLRLLQNQSGADGWSAFEHFFRTDITRIITRRLPGTERADLRQDAYQDICLALIADDYRRLKAYRGLGSFSGFLLHMVDRLLIDFIRRNLPRRQPESPSPQFTTPPPDLAAIPADQPSPEAAMLEHEDGHLLSQAIAVLRTASESLSEPERLYLHIALGSSEPIPAREVARLMRRPVEEVYKLKQRVMTRLRETLEKNSAVKTWRASV